MEFCFFCLGFFSFQAINRFFIRQGTTHILEKDVCNGKTCVERQDHQNHAQQQQQFATLGTYHLHGGPPPPNGSSSCVFFAIPMFQCDIRGFYKALPIFLCPVLMCVYDIPLSYRYPVVWLFCCLVAPTRPCLACILALQSWSLRPHIPFLHTST